MTHGHRAALCIFVTTTRLECIHGRRIRRFESHVSGFDGANGRSGHSPGSQLSPGSPSGSLEQQLGVEYKSDEPHTSSSLRTAGVADTQLARRIDAARAERCILGVRSGTLVGRMVEVMFAMILLDWKLYLYASVSMSLRTGGDSPPEGCCAVEILSPPVQV
jgi:hypothetical protein